MFATTRTPLNEISAKNGIVNPRIRQNTQRKYNWWRGAPNNQIRETAGIQTGQSHPGNLSRFGACKRQEMTPAREQGGKLNRFKRGAEWCCRRASGILASQSSNAGRTERARNTIKRTGRNIYICTSRGNVQRTERKSRTWNRFCAKVRFANRSVWVHVQCTKGKSGSGR